jgi:hypothetical protein
MTKMSLPSRISPTTHRRHKRLENEFASTALEPSECCPCCGQHFSPTRVTVDLNTNIVALREHRWKASPKLAEFVSVLSRATPRMVSKLDLGFALWGMHAPEDPLLANRLGTYATHARRMMEEAGVRIENAEARGFRLIVVEK